MKNKYRFCSDRNCYEIYFSDGFCFVIDPDDFPRVSEHSWSHGKRGYAVYHTSRRSPEGQKAIPLHRFLMRPPDNMDVDHISGDKLDNRKCNLRLCSHQQNMFNQKKRETNTSGFMGVSQHSCGRFEAYVHKNGKKHYLGLYDTAELAARARDRAAQELYGIYAKLNYPREEASHEICAYAV